MFNYSVNGMSILSIFWIYCTYFNNVRFVFFVLFRYPFVINISQRDAKSHALFYAVCQAVFRIYSHHQRTFDSMFQSDSKVEYTYIYGSIHNYLLCFIYSTDSKLDIWNITILFTALQSLVLISLHSVSLYIFYFISLSISGLQY